GGHLATRLLRGLPRSGRWRGHGHDTTGVLAETNMRKGDMGRTSLDRPELPSDCAIYQGLEVRRRPGPRASTPNPPTVRHLIPCNELGELMPIYQGLCAFFADI